MFLVQIIFLMILILGIAWKFRLSFVESVPIGTSLLVLLLYVLAFFHCLSASDYIAIAAVAAAAVYVFRISAEKRMQLLGFVKQEMTDGATITAVLIAIIVTFCVSGKVVSWWDDYNFWATDVKSLFYLDGFAGKYANVAPEFGDYPPGTQMMKWWFLHFSPGEFREGLMFAGYYFMNLAFLFPLLKWIKKHNPLLLIPGGISLWLFPAVAEAFWLDGCCADLTMAVVYGSFLVSVVDGREKGRLLYYGRQALFLMILVLCKNTGFIWVAFGLMFDYGYHIVIGCKKAKGGNRLALFWVTLLPVLTEGSWLSFCLLNRRVAKLTGTAIQMVTGGMNLPEYQGAMVSAFMEAFVSWPLHRGKTFAVDLSPLMLYLLLLIFTIVLYRSHILDKRKACYIGSFLAISGILFYTFNLISHLTIFAVETQYLEPFGMVSSIERYGAPFMIGGLYLLAYFTMQGSRSIKGVVICLLFVFLTTDYAGAYRGIWGYHDTIEETLAQRNEVVDEAAEEFLASVGAGTSESIGRVLYLRDISDISWVRNTYVGFEAAPVSVMYGNIDAKQLESRDIINAIEDAHAEYLYVNELGEAGEALLNPLTDGEDFAYGCLYQVEEGAEGMKLRKVQKG